MSEYHKSSGKMNKHAKDAFAYGISSNFAYLVAITKASKIFLSTSALELEHILKLFYCLLAMLIELKKSGQKMQSEFFVQFWSVGNQT